MNLPSYFDSEQLELYSTCTYFSPKEIRLLYQLFSSVNPEKIDPLMGDAQTRLSYDELISLKALRACPFARRLCNVFSSDPYGKGRLNFEDFLDMMSVFSERAPWNLKVTYAFKIFDFDNDNKISRTDMECTILSLTGNVVSRESVMCFKFTHSAVFHIRNLLLHTIYID